MDPSRFLTRTLRSIPQGEIATQILAASLAAVEPAAAVLRHLKMDGTTLTAGLKSYDLTRIDRIFLIAAGKAGVPMARAAVSVLGAKVNAGMVIVKDGYGSKDGELPLSIKVVEARHPIPDERGAAATREILAMVSQTTPDDLVLCLLSGGTSALLTSPASGISLSELQKLTDFLLRSGANIQEFNTLRKHLDTVKGGGLARAASPAQILSLILSDVVEDSLDVIASGPTTADASTYLQAARIVKYYQLDEVLPASILSRLQRGMQGEIPETLKPADPLFDRVENVLVGSNRLAAMAGMEAARHFGFNTRLLTAAMQGEARQAGWILAGIARDIAHGGFSMTRPACIIAGGETTVNVRGTGLGGRNLELALAAVSGMSGLNKVLLVSLATDGGDGPTDAAGAVVSGETLAYARGLHLSPMEHLTRNDSYPFFAALDDLIKTGPTQTNTNDLVFLFAF